MTEQAKMPIAVHLAEIRRRLIYSVVFLVITTGISFVFADSLIRLIRSRAPENVNFVFIEITEGWSIFFTVSLVSGIALALPFIIYQLIMFVAPALTAREKKYLYSFLPATLLLFAIGVAFGWFVLLPPAINILVHPPFAADIATPMISIGNYISLVTRLLLIIGAAFETPLVMLFLGRIHILTVKQLSRFRKWVIVVAFVVAGVVTPTMDPMNQTLLAVPLIALYELGILLIRIFVPQPKAA